MFILSVVDTNRLPVIGKFMQKGRRIVHQLVLYYVSMLAGRQSAVNRATVDMFNQTVTALETAAARIDVLEQEVALLRTQLGPQIDQPGQTQQP